MINPLDIPYRTPPRHRIWPWVVGGIALAGVVGGAVWYARWRAVGPVPCQPGQLAGKFTDPRAHKVWYWDVSGSDLSVYSLSPGGVLIDNIESVASFDEDLSPEGRCKIVRDYFRSIGAGT